MFSKVTRYILIIGLFIIGVQTTVVAQRPGAGKGSLSFNRNILPKDSSPLKSILEDNRLYVVTQSQGVYILDVTSFDDIKELSVNNSVGILNGGLAKYKSFLYVTDGLNGILIYDTQNNELKKLDEYKGNSEFWDVTVHEGILYAAESKDGLSTFKIEEDGNLTPMNNYKNDTRWGWAWKLKIFDENLYVIDKDEGIKIYSIKNPTEPEYLSSFKTDGTPRDLYVENNLIYVANGPSGYLPIYSVTSGRTRLITKVEVKGDLQAVIKSGKYFLVTAGLEGVYILSYNGNNLVVDFKSSQKSETIGITKRGENVFVSASVGLMLYEYNSPPIFNPLPLQSIDEDKQLTFTRSGYDPDSAAVIISAENLPEGADYDLDTRIFTWTPTYEQSGVYRVYFTITEDTDDQLYDVDTVVIRVNHVNRHPMIAEIAPIKIFEEESFSFNLPAGSDPDVEDDGKLLHFARNLPQGSSFDPNTLVFNWKPTYDQSGVYPVVFGIKDPSGLEATDTLMLTVVHVNRPPVIATIPDQNVDENQPLTFTMSWSDPDTEDFGKLAVRMFDIPEGASFDTAYGVFVWTPTYEQSGEYRVRLKVIDTNSDSLGHLFVEKIVPISVKHISRTPIVVAFQDIETKEDSLITIIIRTYDLDKEDYGLLKITGTNMPEGSTLIDSVFTWKPTFFQSGEYTISFKSTEPSGLHATESIKISVANVNRPPMISDVNELYVEKENAQITYKLNISDPDLEKLVSSISGLPEGATYNSETFTFSWTPTYEQAGTYPMTIKVEDPFQATDEKSFSIQVDNVNRFPIFTQIAPQSVNENNELTFTVSATDPDRQKVVLSGSNLPVGATFESETGVFAWKPTFEQAGTYLVTFTATDEENAATNLEVSIIVVNVNRKPVLAEIGELKGKENENLSITISGSDPDNQEVLYSITNLPSGATIDAKTGVFGWTPTFDQAGNYSLNVKVSDPEGMSDEKVLTISVENVNRAPVFGANPAISGQEGTAIDYKVSANDPDGQPIAYSVSGAPDGLAISNSGSISWTPSEGQTGSYTISITITDPEGEVATISLTIVIVAKPQQP